MAVFFQALIGSRAATVGPHQIVRAAYTTSRLFYSFTTHENVEKHCCNHSSSDYSYDLPETPDEPKIKQNRNSFFTAHRFAGNAFEVLDEPIVESIVATLRSLIEAVVTSDLFLSRIVQQGKNLVLTKDPATARPGNFAEQEIRDGDSTAKDWLRNAFKHW